MLQVPTWKHQLEKALLLLSSASFMPMLPASAQSTPPFRLWLQTKASCWPLYFSCIWPQHSLRKGFILVITIVTSVLWFYSPQSYSTTTTHSIRHLAIDQSLRARGETKWSVFHPLPPQSRPTATSLISPFAIQWWEPVDLGEGTRDDQCTS